MENKLLPSFGEHPQKEKAQRNFKEGRCEDIEDLGQLDKLQVS